MFQTIYSAGCQPSGNKTLISAGLPNLKETKKNKLLISTFDVAI